MLTGVLKFNMVAGSPPPSAAQVGDDSGPLGFWLILGLDILVQYFQTSATTRNSTVRIRPKHRLSPVKLVDMFRKLFSDQTGTGSFYAGDKVRNIVIGVHRD